MGVGERIGDGVCVLVERCGLKREPGFKMVISYFQ